MKNRIRQQDNTSGFTLLELMIALLISGIVLTGVMSIFSTNYRSYILQDDTATMQENIRSGLIVLERDAQMIGSGMIGVDKPGGFNVLKINKGTGDLVQERAYPLMFENNSGDLEGNGESDKLTIRYNRMDEGACGPAKKDGVLACDQLPRITLVSSMPDSSPEAKIKEALSYDKGGGKDPYPCDTVGESCYTPYPLWSDDCYCGNTVYEKYNFFALITAPDGSISSVFALTNVQGHVGRNPPGESNKIQNAKFEGLTNKVVNEYPTGSKISFFTMRTFKEVIYYVKDNTLRQRIIFYPDPAADGKAVADIPPEDQPLAENIEDLQFSFGLDTDGDGEVDQWVNDKNIGDPNIPSSLPLSLQVRLIRINVLGRTSRPNSTFPVSVRQAIRVGMGEEEIRHAGLGLTSDALEDHSADAIERLTPAVAQSGRYYARKLIQAAVKVRSLGLP